MAYFYKKFKDGMPIYLVKHYWWAYLWSKAVWFFDHQPIINAILFGQYKKLMSATLARLKHAPLESVLQLTCVYGSLTPNLIKHVSPHKLHITDVATIQLELANSKAQPQQQLLSTRMNAEILGYQAHSFSTIILFFLLHEMPHEARRNTLSEALRTLQPNGSLIMTEYASLPKHHILYTFLPARWILTKLEPFLDSFWHEDIETMLNELAEPLGKRVKMISQQHIFSHSTASANLKSAKHDTSNE